MTVDQINAQYMLLMQQLHRPPIAPPLGAHGPSPILAAMLASQVQLMCRRL